MSKSNQSSGAKQCMCDKCGATAISIQNKLHRRCPGIEGQALREKHNALPSAQKGKWQ